MCCAVLCSPYSIAGIRTTCICNLIWHLMCVTTVTLNWLTVSHIGSVSLMLGERNSHSSGCGQWSTHRHTHAMLYTCILYAVKCMCKAVWSVLCMCLPIVLDIYIMYTCVQHLKGRTLLDSFVAYPFPTHMYMCMCVFVCVHTCMWCRKCTCSHVSMYLT